MTHLPQHAVTQPESASTKQTLSDFVRIGEVIRLILPFSSDGTAFNSRIRQMQESSLLVEVPPTSQITRSLTPGKTVDIAFNPAALEPSKLTSTILQLERGEPLGCWLQLPQNYPEYFFNRRRHVRVPMDFPCLIYYKIQPIQVVCKGGAYRPQNSPVPIPDNASKGQGTCINLSGGGMRIQSKHMFQAGERLILEFKPDTSTQSMRVQGEVLFSKRFPEDRFDVVTTALKFVDIQQADEDKMVGICFRKELRLRRHFQV